MTGYPSNAWQPLQRGPRSITDGKLSLIILGIKLLFIYFVDKMYQRLIVSPYILLILMHWMIQRVYLINCQ